MLKNLLKTAFRNIWKNKVFSSINIIGLAIGLSASFVIGVIIYYDLTFDKFHADGNRIYRITTDFTFSEGEFYNSGVATPLGVTLKGMATGLETISTFFMAYPFNVKIDETGSTYKNPEHIIFTDERYFDLFTYTWLAGNPQNILTGPYEVVLTKRRAEKYFPSLNLQQTIGKTLMYNDSILVNVTGVVADFTERTDFVFREFISLKTATVSDISNAAIDDNWGNTDSASQLYVKITENVAIADIQTQLNVLAKEHEDKQMVALGQRRKFHLQPLGDIHFNHNYGIYDYKVGQASKSVLWGLSFVALFLLLLGCINFINLNTANATKRAKEIGIRKTLGSSKKQLVFQFMGETFLLTFAAAMVSLLFSAWLLRIFSDFIPEDLNFELFTNPTILILIAVLLLIVTLLSGFYPALVLSHFKPVSVLKNQALSGNNKSSLRRYLTVFQFVIAQIFIIATILVGKQINYLMTKDMGFKTEAIATVRTPWQDPSFDKSSQFTKEIAALPQIRKTSLGGNSPASFSTHSNTTTYIDNKKEIHTSLELLHGDLSYLDLYGLKLLAGRDRRNDTIREYVINETYLKILGFKNPLDAVGQILIVNGERNPIVGVMADFNQRSLKSPIKPMALVGDWNRNDYVQLNTAHFSLQTQNTAIWPDAIAQIENVWKTIYPEVDMELNFVDESVKRFYEQERKTSVLLNWATALAILISCMGLLGLVIHTTERRTKEIGIRKVLGASLAQLNLLLCREFLILVGIAFSIAIPIAWWGMNNWLQDFAYKTEMSWWVFVLSGVAMLLIALVIISIRTIAAANANPVKSLRTE